MKFRITVFFLMYIYLALIPEISLTQTRENHKTQIVLLGTGTPNALPDRSGPATAIIVNETPYIIDFGPGVVRRAAAAYMKGIEALRVDKLITIFATHLHTDHTAGYPDLIFTTCVMGRNKPLEMYGPPGIKEMTDHILKAYEKDIDVRINGLEPAEPEGYKVNVHIIKPGIFYNDKNVRIKAFPVKHGSWDYAYGFRFETPDRTIVISGDCVPGPEIIENSRGVDVLIHEVYSAEGFKKRTPEWQKYHSNFHTSTVELAKIAAETRPKLLILYHQLPMGVTPEKLMSEIKSLHIIPLDKLKKGSQYKIKAKAKLNKLTLPYSLHHVRFFVSLWDFETDWYAVDFIY